MIEESQKILDLNLSDIKEKIKTVDDNNKRLNTQINKFQSIYESSDDKELLKLTLKKENDLTLKKEENNIVMLQLKTELEELKNKYHYEKLELTYYNVKELIINFLENMSNEEKRTSLIKIIKNCQLFGKFIVIDTGELLFIFDTELELILSEKTYNKFKKDKNFKNNFLNSSKMTDDEGNIKILNEYIKHFEENYLQKGKKSVKKISKEISKKELLSIKKELINMSSNLYNYLTVRELGNFTIQEIYLKNKNKVDIKSIIEIKLQEIGIDYPLFDIEKIVSFTQLF